MIYNDVPPPQPSTQENNRPTAESNWEPLLQGKRPAQTCVIEKQNHFNVIS